MIETEVLIVGGGPAGSACAWTLKQHKVDFLVLDKEEFPRPKTCAGWITPRVMRDIVLDPATYTGNFTLFREFKIEINRLRFKLRTRQYAIRRVEFDAWLMQRVVDHLVKHQVHEIQYKDKRYIVDGEYSARYLIGAGGTYCPVKRSFFSEINPAKTGTLIIAQEEEFVHPGASSTCHLWFLQDGLPGYAWYFPKSEGVVNVGVGGGAIGLKKQQDNLKRHWDILVEKLDRYGLVRGHEFRPIGHSYYLRTANPVLRTGNAMLVGDALGVATLDMGEGIGPSIRSGIKAANAIIWGMAYTLAGVARYSFPDLLGWRR
jgi:flavin-dependent dehydrogenase